jgi:hypothetical protein
MAKASTHTTVCFVDRFIVPPYFAQGASNTRLTRAKPLRALSTGAQSMYLGALPDACRGIVQKNYLHRDCLLLEARNDVSMQNTAIRKAIHPPFDLHYEAMCCVCMIHTPGNTQRICGLSRLAAAMARVGEEMLANGVHVARYSVCLCGVRPGSVF